MSSILDYVTTLTYRNIKKYCLKFNENVFTYSMDIVAIAYEISKDLNFQKCV